MNYYERHIGDYLKDTAHLSLLEHGLYGRLLDIYYVREAPLPRDQIARLVGARTDEECAALSDVLHEFFTLDGDAWMHKRCEEEIARFKGKQAQAKRAAAASVASRQASVERSLNDRLTPAERTLSVPSLQTPDTIPKEKTPSPSAPRFDAFWKAYPKKVGKDAARKAFDKRKPDDELLARMLRAIKAQMETWSRENGRFIPNPATWLNEGRWQDEGVTLVAAPAPPTRSAWIAAQDEHKRQVEAERLARKAREAA